ncbi:MAG: sporulation protein YunB [Subdoligranulum sp.]
MPGIARGCAENKAAGGDAPRASDAVDARSRRAALAAAGIGSGSFLPLAGTWPTALKMRMWPAMREVAQHECRSLVVQCLNTAVYGELSANPQRYAGLYTLNGGCLLGDSERINTARAALVQTAQQALNTMPKNDISISLGSLSGSIFLLEMGPGWTVHLNPDGYVEGRMEETMEPAAINRTRFTADLVLETTVNVILNGRAALTQVEVRVPLASFLLDGDVPAYYGS